MIYLLAWKERRASLSSRKLSDLSLMHVEESVIQDNSLEKKHAAKKKNLQLVACRKKHQPVYMFI